MTETVSAEEDWKILCRKCGATYPISTPLKNCDKCGTALDTDSDDIDLRKAKFGKTKNGITPFTVEDEPV